MGILRVYLALCVIAAHAGGVLPWRMHDGRQAVQIFYIISGFYMALVLSSRYPNLRGFYLSRAMRIFPLYWLVLAGSVTISLAAGLLGNNWLLLTTYASHPLDHNGIWGILAASIANFTLFGQDWIHFLSHDYDRTFRFTQNFRNDLSPLYSYLVVPQCWSVGVELTFYAFAPFLNRLRSVVLICILVASVTLRLFTYRHLQLESDPWTYRFFPFEIALFLLGMLAYRLYQTEFFTRLRSKIRPVSSLAYPFSAVILLVLLYANVRLMNYCSRFTGPELSVLIAYPFWALVMPLLFTLFGNLKFDRLVGELSYPVYLVHFAVISSLTLFPMRLAHWERGGICAVVSLALSTALYYLVIVKLDEKRHLLSSVDQSNKEKPQATTAYTYVP